jgi:hypothetical protein
MTIYQTRYRDPKEQQWAETRVGAEMRHTGIEYRFAPCKIEVAIERFEVTPSKPELVRFLNERYDGDLAFRPPSR